MESPPKRVTRSRAAAKATEPAAKTTKIVTAAARARTVSTATASTKSTAAKRKTRADADDVDGEDAEQSAAKRPARGRPRKIGVTAEAAPAPAPSKPTRGRVVKKAVSEVPKEEEAVAPEPAPARATRGRPKKTVEPKPVEEPAQEAPKPTRRGRTTTNAKPAPPLATKPVAKKTVKFQEPDKENVEPPAKPKEPATSGLRGRPVRRPAATAPRSTRAGAKNSDEPEKKPLSPKKVTQMSALRERDDSEDELAGETKSPFMALMKSPIKPPSGVSGKLTQTHPPAADEEEESTAIINAAILDPPDLAATTFGSPARRPPSSPFKDTLKSPAKKIGGVPLPGSTMKSANAQSSESGQISSFKASLLASPAKRPQSPIKGLNFGSVTKPHQSQSAMKLSMLQSPAKRAMPGFKPLTEPRRLETVSINDSPLPKPLIFSAAAPADNSPLPEKLLPEEEGADHHGDEEELEFPGRLSAVLPRHADPALKKDAASTPSSEALDTSNLGGEATTTVELVAHVAEVDSLVPSSPLSDKENLEVSPAKLKEANAAQTKSSAQTDETTSAPQPTQQVSNVMFQLRPKDISAGHEIDYDSDEDMTVAVDTYATTPFGTTRKTSPSKSLRSGGSPTKGSRRSSMGFTLLAEQFGAWSASSPSKPSRGTAANVAGEGLVTPPAVDSPASAHFFEDEMLVRPDLAAEEPADAESCQEDVQGLEVEDPSFEDILVTEEDLALAEEANEMSVMEPQELEEMAKHNQSFDDSLSDASQEYGDENQVPIDPAMLGQANPGPSTPVRPIMRSFNTTTKVPLKPADNSTPSPLKKRSFSASRVAPKRPSVLSRSATVISYSPVKENKIEDESASVPQTPKTPTPVTPSKTDLWSSLGTPARTPRRDIDSSMLRGAIVHVDVYTSDGADASGIFIELLNQMGARCVKTWDWNPTGAANGEAASAKIGVTHVVFKDGGKKTLEKVRLANGIVHCVGVSWVLDCERENEWLDEAPYAISTQDAPHRGGSRRKTMEPGALAGLEEASPSTQAKGDAVRGIQSAPNTPLNRRDSTVWMHTEFDEDADADADDVSHNDMEWPTSVLTPVPKTPAPEAIARYVADMPDTPSADEDEDDNSPSGKALLMRTCPPKQKYQNMGNGFLSKEKDEQVLMRLMAARRKSLQFAPKIGSPLAKTWA